MNSLSFVTAMNFFSYLNDSRHSYATQICQKMYSFGKKCQRTTDILYDDELENKGLYLITSHLPHRTNPLSLSSILVSPILIYCFNLC
jgi:hypothetical protein